LRVFEKSDVIAGYNFDEVLCCRELPKGNAKVVCIVEGVEKIFVEGVDVLESREAV
jgi:hypothetical protein